MKYNLLSNQEPIINQDKILIKNLKKKVIGLNIPVKKDSIIQLI